MSTKESHESTLNLTDRSTALKDKMEKMKKAIEQYKEYKNESSMINSSMNSSRFIEEKNNHSSMPNLRI